MPSKSGQSDSERRQAEFSRVIGAFRRLTQDERQLLTCALAVDHPERLAPLRPKVLRALARADSLEATR